MKLFILLVAAVACVGSTFGAMKVTLTFDDEPKGHIQHAAPILEKYGYRGTFNIVTSWVKDGSTNVMSWSDIRDLKARGHEIASHTIDHKNLVKMLSEGKTNEVVRQFAESRDVIAKMTGSAPTIMCHPFGRGSDEVNRLCRECGMKPMEGCRYNQGTGATAETFRKQILSLSSRGTKRCDVMFHGITAETGGWRPFAKLADFEGIISELKKLETAGVVEVVSYDRYLETR